MTRQPNQVTKPAARSAELVSESFDDGRVVYDERTHAAHSLRADVAAVWDLCDGRRTPDQIAGFLRVDPEFVQRALYELEACDLLEPETLSIGGLHIDRRAMLKRTAAVGGGAALIATAFVQPAFAFGSFSGSNAIVYTVTCSSPGPSAAATGTSSGGGDTAPTANRTVNTNYPSTNGSTNTYCDTHGNVTAAPSSNPSPPTKIGYVEVDLGNGGGTAVLAVINQTQFSVSVTVVSNGSTIYNQSLAPGGETPTSPYITPTQGKPFTVTVS